MIRLVSRVLLLIVAVQLLGGHWAVLQTLAWTRMLIENVQTAPLLEAVEKTFNGSKPCSLCVAVKDGRAAEQQQAVPKQLVKLEAILVPRVVLPPPVATTLSLSAPAASLEARPFAPPSPPPRFA